MRIPGHGWLPFAVLVGVAVAIWGLAAAEGQGWQMLWLPGAIAGAAWPTTGKRRRRRLRGRGGSCR